MRPLRYKIIFSAINGQSGQDIIWRITFRLRKMTADTPVKLVTKVMSGIFFGLINSSRKALKLFGPSSDVSVTSR